MFFNRKKDCLFIIDDDKEVSSMVVEYLSMKMDVKFMVFDNINSALKKLDKIKTAPFAIVSDVSMPDGSGFKLVNELKDRNCNIPTIFITGLKGSLPDRDDLTILGKPVDLSKLTKLLEQHQGK